jgi:hypothetical protein
MVDMAAMERRASRGTAGPTVIEVTMEVESRQVVAPKATTIARAAMVATVEFLEQAMTPLDRRAGPVERMKVTMDLSARAAREVTADVAGTAAAGCSAMMSRFPLGRGGNQEMMPFRARGPVAAVVARELSPTKNLRPPVAAVVVVVRGLSAVAEALVRVAVVVRLECGRLESIASSFVSRWWRQVAVAVAVAVALVATAAAAGKAERASEATKKTRQVAMEPVVAVVALVETVATVAAVLVARRSEC